MVAISSRDEGFTDHLDLGPLFADAIMVVE